MRRTIRNIAELQQLDPAPGTVMKCSWDEGETWTYVKLDGLGARPYQDGAYGYGANREVYDDRHAFFALTDRDFAEGMIVQLATASEIRGKKWSYEH